MKTKIKDLVDEPFYLVGGIIVCVILPFGIYACDVILSVNVIDMQSYKDAIISRQNNFSEIPTPLQIIGERYHVLQTVMHTVSGRVFLRAKGESCLVLQTVTTARRIFGHL